MSIAFDRRCCTVVVMILQVVELYVSMEVAGFGCPVSLISVQRGAAS